MSSHHVVRDEQEPAVIITSPPGAFFPRLAEMFEWSPVVIVFTEALEDFLQWGTKLDAIVGKQEEIENTEELLASQAPYNAIKKNGNSLESALKFLIKNNHTAVNIYTHNIAPTHVQKMVDGQLELFFYNDNLKIVSSKAKLFSKWVAKGTQFKIIEGIITNIENLKLTQNGYEAIENGFINIFGEDDFWVGEVWK